MYAFKLFFHFLTDNKKFEKLYSNFEMIALWILEIIQILYPFANTLLEVKGSSIEEFFDECELMQQGFVRVLFILSSQGKENVKDAIAAERIW